IAIGAPAGQPDVNGIPLAAIERIEILPTTASGIYGGSATGGVINIIRRRDYNGAEGKLTYENTFDTDSAAGPIDFREGLSLEGGKTSILLAGSFSDENGLLRRDRDEFRRRYIAAVQANDPALLLPPNLPYGSTPNIRSVDGSPLFGPGTPNYTSVPAG